MASGRQRAKQPGQQFWATGFSDLKPATQRLALGIQAIIDQTVPNPLWVASGFRRTGGTEHPTGFALDVMATEREGIVAEKNDPEGFRAMEYLVAFLVDMAPVIGIRHIIWNARIYKTRYKKWAPLPGRNSKSSVSDWHRDHAHILLESTALGWPKNTNINIQEEDMALSQDDLNKISGLVWGAEWNEDGTRVNAGQRLARAAATLKRLDEVNEKLDKILAIVGK